MGEWYYQLSLNGHQLYIRCKPHIFTVSMHTHCNSIELVLFQVPSLSPPPFPPLNQLLTLEYMGLANMDGGLETIKAAVKKNYSSTILVTSSGWKSLYHCTK